MSASRESSSPRSGSAHPTRRRACKHALRAALARASLRGTSWLPLSAGQRLGACLAPLAVGIPGRARDALATNLALCFPELDDAARRGLARASAAQAIAAMLELGPLWSWSRARVLALVREVHGLERLDAAVSSGRGAVLLGPHLGAWEVAGLFVSARLPMTTLYRPPRVRALDGLLRSGRERFGARLVPAGAAGVRVLFRSLQRGEVVGLLPDQDPGAGAGTFAPFFGLPARTSTLPARLLAVTDAAPILTWTERLERGRGYRLNFVELDGRGLRGGDVERATRALNLELERLIRRFPRQYLWSYRRFRHPPPGQPDPYRRGHVRREDPARARQAAGVSPP